ncbi:MurR/RpiR family transcriptional regulator [Alkalicella caledoniensis]|uniref:MurR/RpiR family transcriptional regulator n=1 Tax=Alkalicella caledoniensis TaxID=2731377 RepID=A0A7G9W9E3_ALKCA|nr:MurR/RpiR family transcriptional regulator [Alkalicella caledoniensis]QNO15305.1 MurR/RpiR family transcriptional regulator [Alkalicella caledoniensis]
MKSVIVRLREYYNEASTTEKEIVKYVIKHPEETSQMTVYKLAEKTFSSPASIIRMCQKNGFGGFKDFSKALIFELAMRSQNQSAEKSEITKSDRIEDIIEKVTYKNIISLEDTKNLMDPETLNKSIQLLINSENICIYGIGSSLIVAKDAQQKFMRLNKHCSVSDDWHLQLLSARNMSDRDVGIIVSYSGQTAEMIECANTMKENGVKIISITKYGTSPIVEICDYNIFVAANESTFRSGAMSSRISQLNVIDILYTGFANTQYEKSLQLIAKTHIRKGNN